MESRMCGTLYLYALLLVLVLQTDKKKNYGPEVSKNKFSCCNLNVTIFYWN